MKPNLPVALIFALAVFSCKPRQKHSQLKGFSVPSVGTWETPCELSEDQESLNSSSARLSLADSGFSFRRSYFEDESCTKPLYSEVYRGTVDPSHNHGQKNLHLATSAFSLHDSELVETYNRHNILEKLWVKDQDETVAEPEKHAFMTLTPDDNNSLKLSTISLEEHGTEEAFFRIADPMDLP